MKDTKKKPNRFITDKEISFVWNNKDYMTDKEMAEKINRTVYSVRNILYRKRLKLNNKEKRGFYRVDKIYIPYVSKIIEPDLNIMSIGSSILYKNLEWEVLEDYGMSILISSREDYKNKIIIEKKEL